MMKNYPTIRLYNPLSEDFSVQYDINNDGKPPLFTIFAKEIASFPKPVADHIKDHLAKRLAQEIRGEKGNYELAYKEAEKQIEVNLDD